MRFNPLPSCEGRHELTEDEEFSMKLQSTSLLRGKTYPDQKDYFCEYASIHFPLAREDGQGDSLRVVYDASIHFPLAREDFRGHDMKGIITLQSTSLLRGKTLHMVQDVRRF